MSISNCIRELLNIKDKNIVFSDNCISFKKEDDIETQFIKGTLVNNIPSHCHKCGCVNELYSLIKNGTKTVSVKLPKVSNKKTVLLLKKTRYYCKVCKSTFIDQTDTVKPYHSISNNTYHAAILELRMKRSITDISKFLDVSVTTVNNWLTRLSSSFKVNKLHLPKHLSFDEFKSVKSSDSKMSFIFTNAVTGDIVNILHNRRLSYLKSYFYTYPLDVRKQVETICIDMYEPYIQLIKSCFPNALIITDRFHIIQLLNRSLNSTRIQIMNSYPRYYSRLKRYWKLILKNQDNLNYTDYLYHTCYHHKITQALVVDDLLRVDKTFENTYYAVQRFRLALASKDYDRFSCLLSLDYSNCSSQFITSIKTLIKYQDSIINSMKFPYSNGRLEGTNNLIKVIKRIAFGYRSFNNFKTRILLVSNSVLSLA